MPYILFPFSRQDEYLKAYYAALLEHQALAEKANQQESAGNIELATTSSDRQVGMKSKREEQDEEEDVGWEEVVPVAGEFELRLLHFQI